jgi:hypothetical protein
MQLTAIGETLDSHYATATKRRRWAVTVPGRASQSSERSARVCVCVCVGVWVCVVTLQWNGMASSVIPMHRGPDITSTSFAIGPVNQIPHLPALASVRCIASYRFWVMADNE